MRQERRGQGHPVIPASLRASLLCPSAAAGLWLSEQDQPGPAAPSPHPLSCRPRTGITEAAGLPAQAAEGLCGCGCRGWTQDQRDPFTSLLLTRHHLLPQHTRKCAPVVFLTIKKVCSNCCYL